MTKIFKFVLCVCVDNFLLLLSQCFYAVGEHTEDIAEFANSWAVQASDDVACVPTASDFPSPCSATAESTEVN